MNDQIEKLVAPLQELSTLAVSNIKKLTELQLKSIEQSANASVEALQSATTIKDVQGLQAYLSAQAEAAKAIAENTQANAKTIAELGQNYVDESRKIVEGALPKV